jgi:hypothetical protein
MLGRQQPSGVSEAEWRLALDDGERFLDKWGKTAAEMRWPPGVLFDDGAGLVWRLAGRRVVAIGANYVRLNDGRTTWRWTQGAWARDALADEWRRFFDQRRDVAERAAGLSRPDAEARAFRCCVVEWLNRHPIGSSPGRCCWCSGMERKDNVLLPIGIDSSGHAWLHSNCWKPWRDWRQTEAFLALASFGIAKPDQDLRASEEIETPAAMALLSAPNKSASAKLV